jgi:hypothetical protein
LIFSSVYIDENVEIIVENGAIPALVRYLESPLVVCGNVPKSCEHKLEKDCALALGLIAAIQVTLLSLFLMKLWMRCCVISISVGS